MKSNVQVVPNFNINLVSSIDLYHSLSWVQYKCPYLKRKEHFTPTEPINVSTWRQPGDIQHLWVVWLIWFMRGITSLRVLWVNKQMEDKMYKCKAQKPAFDCQAVTPTHIRSSYRAGCSYHPFSPFFPLPSSPLLPSSLPFSLLLPSPPPHLLCEHSRLETFGAQKVLVIENTRVQNAAIN